MANNNLGNARLAKNDEFYTRFADIEKEMNAYLDLDANVFRDKTVLLPCDDPEWSNFTKYFAQNFKKLGLKKLISTSYALESKPPNVDPQLSLFEQESPQYDQEKATQNGRIFVLDHDTNGDNKTDICDLTWAYLEGDGDFRSDELKALRNQADVIITNPPFSLFRKFLDWVVEAEKQFVVIGNMNAITYKETFELIQSDRLWLGATNFNTGMYFRVPPGFVYASTYKFEQMIDGVSVNRVPGVCWFTNLDHGRRHQPLALMTLADNKKFSKHKEVKGIGFQKYDNFDAIEVPFTDAIPSDYSGVMGVPITFLDKYNPEQFEILGNEVDHAQNRAIGVKPLSVEFIEGYRAVGGTGAQRAGGYWVGLTNPNRFPYRRIFIRHRSPAK